MDEETVRRRRASGMALPRSAGDRGITLRARWILPGRQEPISNAELVVEEGRIRSIGPAGQAGGEVLDLGASLIIPGLVNAHTHLDLSGLERPLPPAGTFADWLGAVVAFRGSQTPEQAAAAIDRGIGLSIQAGTTTLGDINAGPSSWPGLERAGLGAVVFRELIGFRARRAAVVGAEAEAYLQTHPATETCRPGLSPHAPYSAHPDLFCRAAELGRRFAAPITIHWAESREELELLRTGGGPIRRFLDQVGAWDEAWRAPPVLLSLAGCARMFAGVRLVLAHANYAAELGGLDPAAIPGRDRVSVVYCPRTHAYFGHPPHPLRRLRAAGIRVCLGTDSLASSPSLSVLDELRFLHRRAPDLEPRAVLEMATLAGAAALGLDARTGSLERGKRADLVVLRLDGGCRDPYAALLEGTSAPLGVMCRGRWLIGPPSGS